MYLRYYTRAASIRGAGDTSIMGASIKCICTKDNYSGGACNRGTYAKSTSVGDAYISNIDIRGICIKITILAKDNSIGDICSLALKPSKSSI